MNWYKLSQQQLLFDPWRGQHQEEQEFPSYEDRFGIKHYNCEVCKKDIPEKDIAQWVKTERSHEYQYAPELDTLQLFRETDQILQLLSPYQEQLNNYLKSNNINLGDVTDEYKIDIPNLPSLLNSCKECKKLCDLDYQNLSSYGDIYELCSFVRSSQSTNSFNVQDFTNLYHNVWQISANKVDICNELNKGFTSRKMYINVLAPICQKCAETAVKCDSCNQIVILPNDTFETVDGDNICRDCFESGEWNMCDDCGMLVSNEDSRSTENATYCESCYMKNKPSYSDFENEIEDLGKNNPKAFKSWFPEGEDRVYLPYIPGSSVGDIDQTLIQELNERGCSTDYVNYMLGYCFKGNKGKMAKVRIGKFIESLMRKEIAKVKQDYPNIAEQQNIIKERQDFFGHLLKQFNESSFRSNKKMVEKGSDYLIVISQNPHDIAKMSTGRDWESCMTLGTGCYHTDVFREVEEGGLIAYLIRKHDKDIEEPVARVLIRRFVGENNRSFAMPEKNIYGDASREFLVQIQNWINSKQGKVPPGNYKRMGGDYSDSYRGRERSFAQLIAKEIIKLALKNDSTNWYKFVKNL
jgi:hypothetical protein